MGDRWGYSRSYGRDSNAKPHYSSSHASSSTYTRSGERDRDRESAYTRSSSSHQQQQQQQNQRQFYHRDDYENLNRGSSHSSRGSHRRDDYESTSYNRPSNRDGEVRQESSSRHYEDTSGSTKLPKADVTPSWDLHSPLGRHRSRSPSSYINRSPPPRPTSTEKSFRKSPSPIGTQSHAAARWPEGKGSVPFNSPATSLGNGLPFDRRPKDSPEAAMNAVKLVQGGIEVIKLKERLKEYVPWLTARKTCIFECRRDKDLKDEVDDIDWCLDVIQDIKSNENVGMQTLSRAQDMVMRLISRGPVTSASSFNGDSQIEITLTDEIYSARSPSPPNLVDGIQFSRRSQDFYPNNSNPRVIPTDRSDFSMVNHSILGGIPVDQNKAFFQMNNNPLFNQQNRNYLYSTTPRSIPADRTDFSVGTSSPVVDNTVYDYGHGQPADEALFERRKPKVSEVPKVSEGKELEAERRKKQWEESSDEDEILIIRKGKNQQDKDMRVYVAESRPGRSKTHRSSEGIRSPEPEDTTEFNMYGFGKDRINAGSLQSRSQAPVGLQQPVLIPQQNSETLLQAHGHLMNMNRPLFNPYLNSLGNVPGMTPSSQHLLKTQTQMMMRFPQVPVSGGTNLIPLPNSALPRNMNPGYRFPNPIPNYGGGQVPGVKDVIVPPVVQQNNRGQTPEEIMMSRIKAKAAESFSHRMKNNQRPGSGNSENQNYGQSTAGDSAISQEQSTHVPSMGPPAQVLDPRLKPRQPRDVVSRDFRRAEQQHENGNQQSRKEDDHFRRSSTDEDTRRHTTNHHDWDETLKSRRTTGRSQNEDRVRRPSGDHYDNGGRYSRSAGGAGDSDIENRDRHDWGRGDDDSRVKRTFITESVDSRSRKLPEDRDRRGSGDHYSGSHRIRRVSGALEVEENVERVSRNFTMADHRDGSSRSSSPREVDNSYETERRHRRGEGDHEGVPTSKFPSLYARVQTVSEKLDHVPTETQAPSHHHSRIDEIRREAEILHPIGCNSKTKTISIGDEKVAPENEVPGPRPRGRKGRSSLPRNTTNSKVREKKSDLSEEEKESRAGLRRSPRQRVLPVKAPVVKSSKSKVSLKRSPGKTVKTPPATFRIPKLKIVEPELTIAERDTDLSDSDHELRIDTSESPSEIDISEDRSPSPRKSSSDGGKQSTSVDGPATSSSLPVGADELIKSLLFSTLSPEEAEVLSSSEDYLASTLARFKEELSAKVKERTRHVSGDHGEASVSTTTPLDKTVETSPESKDKEDKGDEPSRSRSVSRKKPQTKRRSSLEKLHDALREMNFDAMMPLGPRRNLTRMANEELQSMQESNEPEKNTQGIRASTPKLSPVVVLTNVTKAAVRASTASASRTPEIQFEEPATKKRKQQPRRQGTEIKSEEELENMSSGNTSDGEEDDNLPKKKQRIGEEESNPIRKDGAVIIRPNDLIVNFGLSKIKMESDYKPIKSEWDDGGDEKTDSFGADFGDLEMMDLGKDLQLKPGDFGLTEDDNLLFKPEDFQLSLSDEDDLAAMKSEDFDINPDDFVIKIGGLETIKNLNVGTTPLLPEDGTGKSGGSGDGPKRGGQNKKKLCRGVSGTIPCLLCSFNGRKIVEHYVNKHPGLTIPQACLSESAVKLLQESNKSDSPQLMELRFNPMDPIRCLFCRIRISSLTSYCQHLTSHTGEFRFQCSVCSIKFRTKVLAANHCKIHKKDEVGDCLKETPLPLEVLENEFYGYRCGECNYFQINSESIRKHLDITKHSEMDITCIKFKGTKHAQEVAIPSKKKSPSPPKLVPESSMPRLEISLPLPESSISVLVPSKPVPAFHLPVVDSEMKRYQGTKISRFARILERVEESGSSDDVEGDGQGEGLASSATNMESDLEIISSTKETLNRMSDTICCREEIGRNIELLQEMIKTEQELAIQESTMEQEDSVESPMGMIDEDSDFTDSEDEVCLNDFDEEEKGSGSSSDFSESDPPNVVEEDKRGEKENRPELSIVETGEVSTSVSSPPVSTPGILDGTPSGMLPSVVQQTDDDIEGVKDLEGKDLYRCGNKGCFWQGVSLYQYKEHTGSCKSGVSSQSTGTPCFHCHKAFKTRKVFLEHVEGHGKRKLCCALCSFKGRMASVMKRHFKSVHKIGAAKGYSCTNLPAPCDTVWYPKDLYNKRIEVQLIQENPLLYVPRIQFLPDEVDDIPKVSTMSAEVHCALCSYSTKVRRNMIRHLNLHKEAGDANGAAGVPEDAPVNPVPWFKRKELMFDKMTNWAGSTHTAKAEVARSEKEKLPQFVADQFRYVCSLPTCTHLTVDDSMLRAHMRALHSEVDYYECPHCQLGESTRINPQFTVAIDKIGPHLKLHGPKLLKCGHCDFVNIHTKPMEKHVAEKHVEKKPIHYVIRDMDGDTGASRGRKGSTDDGVMVRSSERWRCGICRVVLPSWEDIKAHCLRVHSIQAQFMCDSCQFSTNSIYQVANHVASKICVSQGGEYPLVLIYFSRGEVGEEKVRYPIWRRASAREHLRGIFFLQENENVAETPSTSKPTPATKGPATVPKAPPSVPKGPVTVPKPTTKTKPLLGKKKLKIMRAPSNQSLQHQYLCCQCATFKTKIGDEMRNHLRQHLDYHRFTCKLCGSRSWTMTSFKQHIEADHKETYNAIRHLRTEPQIPELEEKLEKWMLECMPDPLGPGPEPELQILPSPSPKPNSLAKSSPDGIIFYEEITMLD